MSTSTLNPVKRVAEDGFTGDSLCVSLRDGRKIGVPLRWYRKLLQATPEQRSNGKVAGAG